MWKTWGFFSLSAGSTNLDILRCLVKELGADVNWVTIAGTTCLLGAAKEDYLALVRCLVRELVADVNQGNADGSTPVLIAARIGHPAVVRCLEKEAGADENQANIQGFSPLMIAARFEHESVIAFLVEYGANLRDKFTTSTFGTAANQSKRAGARTASSNPVS